MKKILSCAPAVCLAGEDYWILLHTAVPGVCTLFVDGVEYAQDCAGVLPSNRKYYKIRIPVEVLDRARAYTVSFRATIERKSYYSLLGEEERIDFTFRPVGRRRSLRAFYLADIHARFEDALRAVRNAGSRPDLYIVNGDLSEFNTEEDFDRAFDFLGRLAGGKTPILFGRGNHDTRGTLAEEVAERFPTVDGNFYFTFTVGPFCGVVLDCGEDKWDAGVEYGGVNRFEAYRRRELEYLRRLKLPRGKIPFAVSHICPVLTTDTRNPLFDIEREVYTEWNRELERLGIRFMLTGHLHKAFLLSPEDPLSILPHAYPVLVCSQMTMKRELYGTLLTLTKNSLTGTLSGSEGTTRELAKLDL